MVVRFAVPVRFAVAVALAMLCASCGSEDELRITPTRARQRGGEPLRIEGQGFTGHGALVVYIGERAAKQVIVESDRLIRVLSPQCETPGKLDVRVWFDDGLRLELAQAFTCDEEKGIVLQPRIGS